MEEDEWAQAAATAGQTQTLWCKLWAQQLWDVRPLQGFPDKNCRATFDQVLCLQLARSGPSRCEFAVPKTPTPPNFPPPTALFAGTPAPRTPTDVPASSPAACAASEAPAAPAACAASDAVGPIWHNSGRVSGYKVFVGDLPINKDNALDCLRAALPKKPDDYTLQPGPWGYHFAICTWRGSNDALLGYQQLKDYRLANGRWLKVRWLARHR